MPKSGSLLQTVGSWGYLVLAVLAIVAGYTYLESTQMLQAFLLLGVVVGLISFVGKPRKTVAESGVPLLLAGLALNAGLGTAAFNYLMVFVAPAAALVALKTAHEAI